MIASKLDEAIKVVCPIFGVSLGIDNDKSTWRIVFTADATDDQKKAAQIVLDGFDVASALLPKTPTTLSDGQLASVLVQQGVITQAVVDAAIAAPATAILKPASVGM